MNLEVLSPWPNDTLERARVSYFIGVIRLTNDESTIDLSITILYVISELKFNASQEIIRDLKVF